MKSLFFLPALVALGIASSQVSAATVRLDGVGFDIIFDDGDLGLYGTPTLVGDTLTFHPSSFSALSTTNSWSTVASTFSFTLVADAGYTLSGASLQESGNLSMWGSLSSVYAGGQTRAEDLRTPDAVSLVPIGGSGSAAQGISGGGGSRGWTATSVQSFVSGATEIQFNIDNIMGARAGSGAGGLAYITKDFVGLTVVSSVPEPAPVSMFLTGLGIAAWAVRRQRC